MGGVSLGSRIPGAEYNGYQVNGVAGMDYAVQPWLILGVSAGVEARVLTTDFNLGRLESNGGTIAPYFIARLDENYFVEGTFSYTRLVNDLVRNDYPFGTQAAGEYGSNRYAGIVNLHGVWNIDNWRLGATFGYLHVRQDDEAYIEKAFCGFDCSSSIPGKTSDLGQLRGGGRIGYAFGDFIPYVIGRVEYDAIKPTLFGVSVNDRVGGFVGAGFRWNIARAITLSAQGNTIVGRERQTNYGGYATVRYSW